MRVGLSYVEMLLTRVPRVRNKAYAVEEDWLLTIISGKRDYRDHACLHGNAWVCKPIS